MDRMFERGLLSVDSYPGPGKEDPPVGGLAPRYSSTVVVVHGRDLRIVPPPATSTPMPPRAIDLETEEEARKIVDDPPAPRTQHRGDARGAVPTPRGDA